MGFFLEGVFFVIAGINAVVLLGFVVVAPGYKYKARLGKADGESEDEAGVELLNYSSNKAKEDTSV